MRHHRRLIALVCVAVLLLAAITAAASGLPCATLVPLDSLFGAVVSSEARAAEQPDPQPHPSLDTISPRAPPAC